MNNIKSIKWSVLLFIFSLSMESCSIFKNNKFEKERTDREKETTENKTKAYIKSKYALLLGIKENDVKNIALFDLIDQWYGVPYKYGGKSKEGIDCSNFVNLIFENIYHKKLNANSTKLFEMCEVIDTLKLKEGDLVFFKIEQDKISHLGFYLTNKKFVHATSKKGIMINSLEEPYYKKYFYAAGRLQP